MDSHGIAARASRISYPDFAARRQRSYYGRLGRQRHPASRRNPIGLVIPMLATLVCPLLINQTASAQSNSKYTITQITSDPAAHESPSINDRGQIVWSQQAPVGSALLWQVYETNIFA